MVLTNTTQAKPAAGRFAHLKLLLQSHMVRGRGFSIIWLFVASQIHAVVRLKPEPFHVFLL